MITGTSILTSFLVSTDGIIPAGSRVKYVGGGAVSVASATDADIGYAILDTGKLSYAVGDAVGVMMKRPILWAIAASALADGAVLEPAASGQVDDTAVTQVAQTSVANATTAAVDLPTSEALANANKTQGNALVADVAALITAVNALLATGKGIALGAATDAGDLIPFLPR